jgi:predicted peroxiredoxin
MPDNFLIVLSCGTDNPNRATRGLQLAAFAAKEGRKTTVFLLDEGVYLAKKGMAANLTAATGDKADDHLQFLQEFEVPILACTPCLKSRQISEKDLIKGARLATASELIEMSFHSAVISL